MYDLIGPRAPLEKTDHADIRCDVLEGGVLENYLVQCSGDGSFLVFVDGVPSLPEGIKCTVGAGPTANSFFDVFVELEVPLKVVYSPDIPLFWSASAPPPQPCPPGQPGCHPSGAAGTVTSDPNVPVSATITFASSSGKTTVMVPSHRCHAGPALRSGDRNRNPPRSR